ncbi:MAG TPA: amidohydrolase family protein [Polyangia bacterium]|nr:amidohydrolase family protein [Polyangia bacterium]
MTRARLIGMAVAALSGCHSASAAPDAAPAGNPKLPRIDMHMHISPMGIDRLIKLMDRWGIDGAINLSGMYPGPKHMLETQLEAARKTGGRVVVFANVDFKLVLQVPDYGKAMAAQLAEAKKLGAVGLKIPKGLGLGYARPDGQDLLPVDDPGLDPLFEKAGELGMPVAIHTGDPKAFWKPANKNNERWDELQAHPEWSFHGEVAKGIPWPSWEALYKAFERRVARHPKTNFIGVHFGNDPEDPEQVARMLDKYPNLYIDTAARVPEIGRHDPEKMRRFYIKYQDRVLFGTDTGVGESQDEMMYGSNGANPPTEADEKRFFQATWRYFETRDKHFESPTPIQGRWKIDGVGLPEAVLRKIYFENAARLLKWKPPLRPGVKGG